MNSPSWGLLALAGAFALVDWLAVARGAKKFEYVSKPATLLALIGVAATLESPDGSVRWWFVAALCLSLLGDIFLMLPRDAFVPGLASFLAAHFTYSVGLGLEMESPLAAAMALGTLLVSEALVGGRLVANLEGERSALRVPVLAYLSAISVMVTLAVGTLQVFAIAGAILFYCSDALIGWTRFVKAYPWAPVAIMVTYHGGQTGLVLSLLA